jgi:hypothetical protein
MTYTPADGLCLRSTHKDAPQFPAWHFQKVTLPCTKPPMVTVDFAEILEKHRSTGVCFNVGYDVAIEWREDGGMRVWNENVAYDSYTIQRDEMV